MSSSLASHRRPKLAAEHRFRHGMRLIPRTETIHRATHQTTNGRNRNPEPPCNIFLCQPLGQQPQCQIARYLYTTRHGDRLSRTLALAPEDLPRQLRFTRLEFIASDFDPFFIQRSLPAVSETNVRPAEEAQGLFLFRELGASLVIRVKFIEEGFFAMK